MEAMLRKIYEDFLNLSSFSGDPPPPITLDQINEALRYRVPSPPQPVHQPGIVRYPVGCINNSEEIVEYRLPCETIPPEIFGTVCPWMRALACKSPVEAQLALQGHWRALAHACHQRLADRLLEYLPHSLVAFGGQFWLRLVLPGKEATTRIGNQVFLAAPLIPEEFRARCLALNIRPDSCLGEFLENFAGLAEDYPSSSGNFLGDEPWRKFDEDDWMSQIKGYPQWRDSLLIYNGRGGDGLLLHSRGDVAWWYFAEHEVDLAFPSFAAAIEDWVDFNRQFEWPYEARVYVEDNPEARRPPE